MIDARSPTGAACDTSKADTDLHWALDTVCHENLNRAKVCGRRQQAMNLGITERVCWLAVACLLQSPLGDNTILIMGPPRMRKTHAHI